LSWRQVLDDGIKLIRINRFGVVKLYNYDSSQTEPGVKEWLKGKTIIFDRFYKHWAVIRWAVGNPSLASDIVW